MIKHFILTVLFFNGIFSSVAQNLDSWSVYPSYSTVTSIFEQDQITYVATLGGIFVIEDDIIIKTLTTNDGLHTSSPNQIVFDAATGILFAGYNDGTIDVINSDTYDIISLADIYRVDRFNDKEINKMVIYDDQLYIATNFGIVIYDLNTFFVESSVVTIGSFDTGTSINDIDIISDSIYAATDQGIATANISSNLADPSTWNTYGESTGIPMSVVSNVQIFNDTIYTLIENTVYTFADNVWSVSGDFPVNEINNLVRNVNDSGLIASTDNALINLTTNDQVSTYSLDMESTISSLYADNSNYYIGTTFEGALIFNSLDESTNSYQPSGPYLNFFSNTMTDNMKLLSTSTAAFPSSNVINLIKGYYIYENEEWSNYNRNLNTSLGGVESVYSLGMNDSSYYFGSWGSGIIEHRKSTNAIKVYNRQNSALEGISSGPNYVVITGLDNDKQQNMWAVSYLSDLPLYVKIKDTDEWLPFNNLSGSDNYFNLFVDSYDQKWISLVTNTNTGLGLLVIDTGVPEDPNDDQFVKLTSATGNGNLPDEKIKAIVQDRSGEVWIGTERGIARFIFPELIITGGAAERQAQWLINEDTTQASRFLLRDVNVTAMAVNDANQKWVGSENQGLWLLNEEGSQILKRLTVENSNLISNNIQSISVMNETGQVFIATDGGLVSYQDVPKSSVPKMKDLKVYPNPFKYGKYDQILIEGLSDITRVRIVGVDGFVVNDIQAKGGRISWDGYDYNGNKLGSGVYFVIAYESDGKERGVGKIVIVK